MSTGPVAHAVDAPGAAPRDQAFEVGDLTGQIAAEFAPLDGAELLRAIDPESAAQTIHWGRNYLYVTPWRSQDGDSRPVVVKQFRNASWKARMRRRARGTKAARSFQVARKLQALEVGTARPILYADSVALEGPAFFLCEQLEGLLESRYLLRSLSAGTESADYPELDSVRVFEAFGRLVRTLHEGDVWHRDLTCGNLLIDERLFQLDSQGSGHQGLYLLDLNRARTGRRLSLSECMRDLCRLEVPARLLPALWRGYWRESDSAWRRSIGSWLRNTYASLFLLRNRSKSSVRGVTRRLGDMVLPRRKPHAHIPATEERSAREKTVWDKLSDQPHQHASKWEKLRVRIADSPEHLAFLARAAGQLPKVRRRTRALRAERFAAPREMDGFGLCVRPWEADEAAVPAAVHELGIKKVLLRLHPWQQEHEAELRLAHALLEQGVELAFSLPQDRSLVRDQELWRSRVEQLAGIFAPLGDTFQIGQAINRSKWGVWRPSEYHALFGAAEAVLRAVRPDVRLLGPAIIDFEFQQTIGYLADRRRLEVDGVASLLYVDRRGAPEEEQLGLDALGKAEMLRAITDCSPSVRRGSADSAPQNWVTEVNWPLWEGPHSPAGRDVAVDEEAQARYLARYYLPLLAAGAVDRIYWWQLIAKGYGLVDWHEAEDGSLRLRRRPSFTALATLVRELQGARFEAWVGTAGEGQWLLRFSRAAESGDGREEFIAGWSVGEGLTTVDLPVAAAAYCGLDGEWREHEGGRRARLSGEVRLFRI